MDPGNRAGFRKVVIHAATQKKQLKEFLSHTKHLEYQSVLSIAKAIERALLEQDNTLDVAETRRFAEIITGVADRTNHEAQKDLKEFLNDEIKGFRNTKRQVVLDERYDIQSQLTDKCKSLYDNWIALNKEEPDENSEPVDPLKKIERDISFYNAFANAFRACDVLVQKDIESYIQDKSERTARSLELQESNRDNEDFHQRELNELLSKFSN